MEVQQQQPLDNLRVKASFRLGTETYLVQAPNPNKDLVLSEELVSFKEATMSILKDYITRHNVPNDVPEPDDVSSDDEEEDEIPDDGTPTKSKKRK